MARTCLYTAMRLVLPTLAILLFTIASSAADLVLSGAKVYPSPDAQAIADADIVVHNGRLAAVGRHGSVRIPTGSHVLDFSGRFIVAGFWNSHVHIFTPALLHVQDSSPAALNEAMATMFTRWGFTTVFDVASVLDNTRQLQSRIEDGRVVGPRILTVGEPLWTEVPVYVRDFMRQQGVRIAVVTTSEDAVRRVRAQAEQGVNGIKLFTGSIQSEGKVANMPLDMVRAAVQEAHRHGLPVFAHPQNLTGLEVAITGGVDILAHTAPDSPPWTPAFVARLNRAHMALIPTLTLFDFEARKGGASDQEREAWLSKMVAELRAFSQGGGEVLFGTDIGYTDHYDTTLEFTLMARAGMTFKQILASVTTNPARRFGFAKRSGRIEPGMDADLVVLDDDPAKDITAFSRVRTTIRGGVILYSHQNKADKPRAVIGGISR